MGHESWMQGLPWPCSDARTVLSYTGSAATRRRLSLCPVQADRSNILRATMTDTRIVTRAYRYKWPPPEGEPLLRLHTDAVQDENDVAMASDC
jgi:hypothetical protein